MKNLWLILPLFWIACSTPRLNIANDNQLGLRVDDKTITVSVEKKLEDRIVLDRMTVERTLYTLKGRQIEAGRSSAAHRTKYE